MAILSLTITASDREVISGIPEYIEFSTNVTSTVFYTLDGSTPTVDSEIAVGKVFMPLDGTRVVVKSFAVSMDATSSIISVEYYTVQNITKNRLIGNKGNPVSLAGEEQVESLGYDGSGNPERIITKDLQDLDFIASTTNSIGEDISGDSTLKYVNFSPRMKDVQTITSSANSAYFDPKASVIFINGELTFENDLLRIYNRPHNTMEPVGKFYTQNQSEMAQSGMITGNLSRYMYNPNTGKIVFYYYESRENRTIISQQTIEKRPQTVIQSNSKGMDGKFVFRWVEDRAMSKIY